MSAGRPTGPAAAGPSQARPALRRPSLWQRTPLWLRLITGLLALATLGLTLTGVFGARLLRNYLTARVDDQLRAAASTIVIENLTGRPIDQELPSPVRVTFQDRLGRTVTDVRSRGYLQEAPDLPPMTPAELQRVELHPFTVPGEGGGANWRVLALDMPNRMITDTNGTQHQATSFLVAMSLADVNATVESLVHIDLIVGALVLAGLALAGYSMVRTAMRPLNEIERTATAIAGGDLSKRIANEDPHTEVGRLGAVLNTMLNQIEGAFRAQTDSEARARRSEERMRQFVADASHELRTPLTSIRGFAELHRQGAVTDPGEVAHLLGRIEAEATHMGLLVDDMLLLARLDQQRPLRREPVDVVVVANDAAEAARAIAPDRHIRLVAAGPQGETGGATEAGAQEPRPWLMVAGDEPRLRQVVTNLVDNALSHTPPGMPVTVRVARTVRSGRSWVVLEVADEGPGLAPGQAERVFERFYRTDTARSREQGGTGLGLSIVAAITAAHGGAVEVESEPGRGSTFRVMLPLYDPAAGDGPAGGTRSTPPRSGAAPP